MHMDLEFAITTAQPAPVGPVADRGEAVRPTVNHVYLRPRWGDVVAEWACPVCGTSCNRTYHSGRSRVYCTNACRQRAYRLRRRAAGATGSTATPVRARTRDGLHALRSYGDLVAGRRDSTGRQVTACGAFARSTRDRPSFAWHTDFIAGGPSSCRTCATVLHVEPTPVATMLERALRYAAERRTAH
jgi:hypothetical protein